MFETIGTDAEVFVQDIKTKAIESSIGLIEGTKEEPQATKNGFIQKDNVLAEFNSQVAHSRKDFVKKVLAAMGDLEVYLGQYGKTTLIQASNYMDAKWLKPLEAQAFGCDPDFSVWHLDTFHQVNAGMADNLRTAAAHVHIGIKNVTPDTQISLVKLCDLFLGLPSLFADEDVVRRKLYGTAGSFRPKEYGVEYRVLSNFWLKHPYYMGRVYDGVFKACKYIGDSHEAYVIDNKGQIEEAINNRDLDLANHIMGKIGLSPWPTHQEVLQLEEEGEI